MGERGGEEVGDKERSRALKEAIEKCSMQSFGLERQLWCIDFKEMIERWSLKTLWFCKLLGTCHEGN